MGKTTPVTKGSVKKNPASDNYLEMQRNSIGRPLPSLEALEARYRKSFFHQKEKISQEIKSVFDSRDRALKNEVRTLKEEIALTMQTEKKISREVDIAVSQEIVSPGTYHVEFLSKIRSFIQKIIRARRNMENSTEWLQVQNHRGKKKGQFWSTFTSNKQYCPKKYLL